MTKSFKLKIVLSSLCIHINVCELYISVSLFIFISSLFLYAGIYVCMHNKVHVQTVIKKFKILK